jgi:hypothetical protein
MRSSSSARVMFLCTSLPPPHAFYVLHVSLCQAEAGSPRSRPGRRRYKSGAEPPPAATHEGRRPRPNPYKDVYACWPLRGGGPGSPANAAGNRRRATPRPELRRRAAGGRRPRARLRGRRRQTGRNPGVGLLAQAVGRSRPVPARTAPASRARQRSKKQAMGRWPRSGRSPAGWRQVHPSMTPRPKIRSPDLSEGTKEGDCGIAVLPLRLLRIKQ